MCLSNRAKFLINSYFGFLLGSSFDICMYICIYIYYNVGWLFLSRHCEAEKMYASRVSDRNCADSMSSDFSEN
jgi:hypothetical protein